LGKKGQVPWNKGKKGVQVAWNKGKKGVQVAWNKGTKGIMKPNSTSFKKGQPSWSKGLTKETNELIRKTAEKRTGQKRTDEMRKNAKKRVEELYAKGWSPRKGKRHSAKSKQLMHEAKIGSKHPFFGKHFSAKHRKNISIARLKQKLPFKDAKSTEIPLQNFLKNIGVSFETHKNLKGQPDIFIEPNICIFADGDYWHGWKYLQGEDFSRFKKFNNDFFEKRIKNDENNTRVLTEDGYNVLRFWEHEIKENPAKCFQKIIKIIKESGRQRG